jgi:hypothetical protein
MILRAGLRHVAFVCAAIIGLGLIGASLPGCTTLAGGPSSEQLAAQVAVQYATGKFVEAAGPSVDARLARARQVKAVAEQLRAVASSDSATIAALHELAMVQVAKASLAPADRLLANTLVDIAVQELSARVSTGALNAEARVAVTRLLDWVVAAASAYG